MIEFVTRHNTRVWIDPLAVVVMNETVVGEAKFLNLYCNSTHFEVVDNDRTAVERILQAREESKGQAFAPEYHFEVMDAQTLEIIKCGNLTHLTMKPYVDKPDGAN